MHFALPPKKSSYNSYYSPRSSRIPSFRRSRLKYLVLCAFVVGVIILILWRVLNGSNEAHFALISGVPPVIIVTVFDKVLNGTQYAADVKENRNEYARRHGYETFFPDSRDYPLEGAPESWAKIPALRHAMTKWPHTTYFWLLDSNALVMNLDLAVEALMHPKRLENLMIKDQPVVPPDSVIKTFSHIKARDIEFVLTQDDIGLAPHNFVLKRGDWAKFFLDTWFDPLFRSYNFQKADRHALEHIVQWHPTILAKLALVPQKTLNSHDQDDDLLASYSKGDFVVHFKGCPEGGEHGCETAAIPYMKEWRKQSNIQRKWLDDERT